MGIGWPQLLIIALVILVLFGRGRIADMMGDFGKGISSFKKGMNEDDSDAKSTTSAQIEAPSKDPAPAETKSSETSDSSN